MRLDQRPWVLPVASLHVDGLDLPPVVRPQRLRLSIKNHGRSPALKMKVRATWSQSLQDDPEPTSIPQVDLPITLLAPDASQSVRLPDISIEVFNFAWSGGGAFRVFGVVEYFDIFQRREPYVTKFCFRLHGRDDDARFAQEGPFNDCT